MTIDPGAESPRIGIYAVLSASQAQQLVAAPYSDNGSECDPIELEIFPFSEPTEAALEHRAYLLALLKEDWQKAVGGFRIPRERFGTCQGT